MIEINNLTARTVSEEFIVNVAKLVLKGENKKNASLSIALVGPKIIKALNKKYRGKNRATDVLAFCENSKLKTPGGLGETVICPGEVDKNAKRFGFTFKKELARVLIHGLLHLLGYDHERSEKEAKKMERKQEYYLSQLEIRN